MTITYFTIENINSGLFKNQVLNKLQAIVNNDESICFEIIVFNSPFHRKTHKELLSRYNEEFADRIKIRYYPVLPPLRYVLSSLSQSIIIMKWLTFVLRFIKINGELIHCRSYWPTVLALKVSNKPVLFDVRSLYPAESVAANKLKVNSYEYNYWMKLERYCFDKSKGISVVSKPMINYIKRISNNPIIDYNPIIVNTNQIFFDKDVREKYRKELGWENCTIFTYSGSLGYNGLNKPALGPLLKKILDLNANCRLLFLSSESKKEIGFFLREYEIMENKTYLTEATTADLFCWLSAADIGIHALPLQLDSDTRLGTKVVEYWANGLPVILNENVGAAVDIVNEKKNGFVLNSLSAITEGELQSEIDKLLSINRQDISGPGSAMFNADNIARQYIETYKKCLQT